MKYVQNKTTPKTCNCSSNKTKIEIFTTRYINNNFMKIFAAIDLL